MAMERWEPFRDILSLRNAMERLLDESFTRPSRLLGWRDVPALDMYQTDNSVVIKAALPGVKADEVDISITGEVLTIKGEHKEEKEAGDDAYICKERRYGAFNRSLILPAPVQSNKAEAVFENGILTLTLPKAEEAKPKQIKIKSKTVIEGAKD